jgi:hypothetical protein
VDVFGRRAGRVKRSEIPCILAGLFHPIKFMLIRVKEVFVLLSVKSFRLVARAVFFHKETGKPRVFKKRILGPWFPYGFSVAAAPRRVFRGSNFHFQYNFLAGQH